MTTTHYLTNELKFEAAVTRRYLERVPLDMAEFKPSEMSETLGRLAIHVAEILAWWRNVITEPELDFLNFEPITVKKNEELLNYFDELLAGAIAALASATEEDLAEEWSMRHGEVIYFTLPKRQVLRIFCMNHLVHHRAQLGVYFRMLGIEVPATYGPSADDDEVILISKFLSI